MTYLRHGRLRRPRVPRFSIMRCVLVAVGLAMLATSIAYAAGPYQLTREFRRAVGCDQRGAECFASEAGTIRDRNTYKTTTTSTDANGISHTTTTTTTHYEITWERANGARETREVSRSLYDKAKEGQPARLRIWRGEVVRVEVVGGSEWFLPESGLTLALWLLVAWAGLGVSLWGLFFGWWDGFLLLAVRTLSWLFISLVPVATTISALAYGWDTGNVVVEIVGGLLFSGVAVFILIGSLEEW